MEEFFDILNENGEYLNEVQTRDKCHKEGLWHKAIAVFIINSKGQVLLQKRSSNKKMWPNMWDITSGGHVLSGEFGFQAAIRETKEELGVNLDREDITFIGSVISNNKKNDILDKHFNEYYIVNKDIDETKLKLQKEEVSEVKWMDKQEIINRIKNNYDGITDKTGCWEYLVKYYDLIENNK
ncbi:MAG: NUDIX domain-containing protein [Clostridia bacterium]|nr:NUDIX domain-containing protein [Clostridia bacterium]